MNRNLSILGLGLVAIIVAIVAWPLLSEPRQADRLPQQASDKVAAQSYPGPPGTLPPPTATPPADPDGYLPPPSGVAHQVVTLAGSPYSELLMELQAALDSGNSAWLAGKVTERFGNQLFDIDNLDSEGGAYLTAADAEAVLADFFRQGSRPVIQGYFDNADPNVPCLTVVSHRFQGTVPYPGEDGGYGAPRPTNIPADAASFSMCDAGGGEWIWMNWVHGGYYEIVETYDAARDWDYFVVRP